MKDFTGQKFGRLTVLEKRIGRHGRTYWYCRCECGSFPTMRNDAMQKNISCGCFMREKNSTHGHARDYMSCSHCPKDWII